MSDEPAPEEVYREFIREMTLRIERAVRAMAQESRANREESRLYFEALRAEMRDLHEESRAQTGALLRVLDRLDNGGTAPAT